MKYSIFVASTYVDMKRQRDHAIDKLRKAGLEVVCMEDFSADSEHPAKLSEMRVKECDFCVAFIGYQTGTVSTAHGSNKSIVQIEISAAKEHGLLVLPFVLRDTAENINIWPDKYNNLADEYVRSWRAEIGNSSTVEFFDAGELPDVLPSITRQITKLEGIKRRQLIATLFITCSLLVGIILLPFLSHDFRIFLISQIHRHHDPVVFGKPANSNIKVARLLENRSEINAADFGSDLLAAKHTFSMFANTFGSFRKFKDDYEAAAKRGVKLQFIVTDFSEDNRGNWQTFTEAVEDSPKALDETIANGENIRSMIRDLQVKYPRNVHYKLNRKPLLYTFWIRDENHDDALAHIGVHYYGKTSQVKWPAYRVSKNTGGEQLSALKDQFKLLWQDGIIDNGYVIK